MTEFVPNETEIYVARIPRRAAMDVTVRVFPRGPHGYEARVEDAVAPDTGSPWQHVMCRLRDAEAMWELVDPVTGEAVGCVGKNRVDEHVQTVHEFLLERSVAEVERPTWWAKTTTAGYLHIDKDPHAGGGTLTVDSVPVAASVRRLRDGGTTILEWNDLARPDTQHRLVLSRKLGQEPYDMLDGERIA